MDTPDGLQSSDALRRYEVLMQQNRFEHTSFWSRFGFMLISQIALFGFFLNLAYQGWRAQGSTGVWLLLPLCVIGLAMVALFYRLHMITAWWIDRWLKLIRANEEAAFGHVEVARGTDPPNGPPGSVRKTALAFTALLGALWILAATIVVSLAVARQQP